MELQVIEGFGAQNITDANSDYLTVQTSTLMLHFTWNPGFKCTLH
jgi:hypothetical protein